MDKPPTIEEDEARKKAEFKKELQTLLGDLINGFSMENFSDTPDFILAEFLYDCLEVFNKAIENREKWYGREREKCDKIQLAPNQEGGLFWAKKPGKQDGNLYEK